MCAISPFFCISLPCDEASQVAEKYLSSVGWRHIRTFNLQTARLGLHDCLCPNHGTNECDCQMIVLIVYGETNEPVTLTLHGNSGQTWLALSENSEDYVSRKIAISIQEAFDPNTDPE